MNRSNPPIPNQALFEEVFNIKIIKGKGILGLMDGCGNTLYLFAMNGVFFFLWTDNILHQLVNY